MRKLNVVSFGVGVIGGLTAKYILEEQSRLMSLFGAFSQTMC